jgi:voltage-gated potassium channel
MLNPFKFFKTFFSLLASAGWVLLILLIVFFALASTLYLSEMPGINHSPNGWWETLYLSAITALTVGYGDVAPNSPIGRLAAVGLGFLGIMLTGIVVAAAIKALEKASENQNG